MSRKILMVMWVGMLVLSACAPAFAAPDSNTPPAGETPVTPLPDDPVSSEDPQSQMPVAPSWQPAPGDENLNRSEAQIELAELLTLESFPPQYQLHMKGWKGNPCSLLRVQTADPDNQNRINVDVYILSNPDEVCIQSLEGFDINVPLGSLEKGEYTVWVNGAQVGTISAP